MTAQSNAQPIIIKKKKKGGGDGHHGGAWKVAYADFVTAMMAFFMLMWLLNATTEQQRAGVADYFSPTIPINKVSGGGDGAFGGDSIFSEETLPQTGKGATQDNPTEARASRGETGQDESSEAHDNTEEAFETVQEELLGKSGESSVSENLLEHINTKVTDEGLVIEVFALDGEEIFEGRTPRPTRLLQDIAILIADAAKTVRNGVAVEGHVPAVPLVRTESDSWEISSDQASAMRQLLEGAGMQASRIERVTGHADREPSTRNPMDIRNNRLEIILLREKDSG